MLDPRTTWQTAVEAEYLRAGKQDFLLVACPGAGKTRAALMIARTLWDTKVIEQIVIVAPTVQVCQQWSRAAHQFGLDIPAKYESGARPSGVVGWAITYQLLGMSVNALVFGKHTATAPTLVIFDEIHHAADIEHTSWGPAIQQAFGDATRRLALSGTPFRSDRCQIPFTGYDGNGVAVSDYSLSYKTAVKAGICRPVVFEVMNGRAKFLRGNRRFEIEALDTKEKDRAGVLGGLFHSQGEWLPSMLTAADAELTRQREEKPNAGGLAVAADIKSAKDVAKHLETITGQHVPVVTSENSAEATKAIDRFRTSAARWIVAVQMISEGVDIPRLTTLVSVSKIMTELWFRQFVGRGIRQDGSEIGCTVFIPAIPELMRWAKKIEDEASAGLREAVPPAPRSGPSFDIMVTIPLPGTDTAHRTGIITPSTEYTAAELDEAEQARSDIGGLRNAHVSDIAAFARRVRGGIPIGTFHTEIPASEETNEQVRLAKRRQIKHMVNVLSIANGAPQKHIHAEMNRRLGEKNIAAASIETLDKRIEMLTAWL